jgi:hypothetical protein
MRIAEEGSRATFKNAAVGIAHEVLIGLVLRFIEQLCSLAGYAYLLASVHPADRQEFMRASPACLSGEIKG